MKHRSKRLSPSIPPCVLVSYTVASIGGAQRPGVAIGDIVYTVDGHRLGDVVTIHHEEVVVEVGLMFRWHYVVHADEITHSEGLAPTTALTPDAVTRPSVPLTVSPCILTPHFPGCYPSYRAPAAPPNHPRLR